MKIPKIFRLFAKKPQSTEASSLASSKAHSFVRCPHCSTLYAFYPHVVLETVGDVRCGTCTNTFDSMSNQSQPKVKVSIPAKAFPYQPRLSKVTPTYLPQEETIEESEEPEELEEFREEENFLLDNDEESFSLSAEEEEENEDNAEAIFSIDEEELSLSAEEDNDAEAIFSIEDEKNLYAEDFTSEFEEQDPLDHEPSFDPENTPEQQPPHESKPKRKWSSLLVIISLILAFNLLLASLAWINRDVLLQNTLIRSWVSTACNYLHCQLPEYHDPSKIIVQQHQLTAEADNPARLQLHAFIQNTSPYPQPLANLQMDIDDLQGNLVNTLVFKPSDYAASDPNLILQPGQTLHITMIITQPTPDIFSYELKFI